MEKAGKKYELTSDVIEVGGRKLFRIKALRNFANVKAGDLGGYIEKEENLSHEGNCWVGGDAWVYEDAEVRGNAVVRDNAKVYGNAKVSGIVYGYVRVYDTATVMKNDVRNLIKMGMMAIYILLLCVLCLVTFIMYFIK